MEAITRNWLESQARVCDRAMKEQIKLCRARGGAAALKAALEMREINLKYFSAAAFRRREGDNDK